MCKTEKAVNASDPDRARPSTRSPRTLPRLTTSTAASSSGTAGSDPSTSNRRTATYTTTLSSALSSRISLSSLHQSLFPNPHIYSVSQIRAATNNFLAKHYSSSSSSACWRCTLGNSDTLVFRRKFRRKTERSELKQLLPIICRSHHRNVIKLLGASVSEYHIYLVYEFINGANLADCLRNSKNPNFTVLSNWISRMQIVTDFADALDYIHGKTGINLTLVHNHIKSSSVIVTETSLNAMICHFGTAQLCGEAAEGTQTKVEDSSSPWAERSNQLTRSDSRALQFEGVRGYMSPEFLVTGIATQKSDVYAFGVVILELLSGEEPLKYKYDKRRGDFVRTSLIDTARAAVDGQDDGRGTELRLRKWVDSKLRDSFPVEVVEKLTRLALGCVHEDPDKRPDMGRVAAKISRLYIESRVWSDNNPGISDRISVSLAPR